MNSVNPIVYRAAWVWHSHGPPIPDGAVRIDGDRITSVDRFSDIDCAGAQVIDLGQAMILPGLVNAHTHLEFSHLQQPLGHPGIPFTDWIRLVVKNRQALPSLQERESAIEMGLREAFASGTWQIGEIATLPVRPESYRIVQNKLRLPIRVVAFLERLGRAEARFPELLNQWQEFYEHFSQAPESTTEAALSPHAPYSVHPALLDLLCKQAIEKQVPVAMHLAETFAERELLALHRGPFVELLKDFGVWNAESFEPRLTIRDLIDRLAACPTSMIIHGNNLNIDDIRRIAKHRQRMTVVYCPRTHAYFGHDNYPMMDLVNHTIPVALGTDSRASNPDLNLFAEMQYVAANYPELGIAEILAMGTDNGRRALDGPSYRPGSLGLQKNQPAQISVITASADVAQGPYERWVLCPEARCRPLTDHLSVDQDC